MTNGEIMAIALQQSAYDCNCRPQDFLATESVLTTSCAHPLARRYLSLPFECDLVSYGSNIVAQTSPRVAGAVERYIRMYPPEHAFETPHLQALDADLAPFGLQICFMAEYFLPDVRHMQLFSCAYTLRVLRPPALEELYLPQWSNALCEQRKELDILAVGAYDGDRLVGLAGASADCDMMYQIGVDVLPAYRRQGIATALTSRLADEIFSMGKVPFYCAAWCNIRSVRNAVSCGFRPAWVEVTARDTAFVKELNQKGSQLL